MIILKSEPKAKPNNRKREQEKQRNTLYIIFTRVSARPAYAIFYQVLAETERFVWLARDHTLYPGSWSKWNWKPPLNKITSSVVQQTKRVNTKTFTASTPPPPLQMERSQLLTARYQTVPFLTGWCSCALQFFLLCCRPNCISKVQWSIVVFCYCFSGGGGFFTNTNRIVCIIICFNQRNHWNG